MYLHRNGQRAFSAVTNQNASDGNRYGTHKRNRTGFIFNFFVHFGGFFFALGTLNILKIKNI